MLRHIKGVLLLYVMVSCFGSPGLRAAVVTFGMALSNLSATTADFDVSVTFAGKAGDNIQAVQLSVLGNSDALTSAGTDYTRFSFIPTYPGWTEISPVNFGLGFYAPVDPINGPFLGPGTSILGDLSVDISDLAPGTSYTVTLGGGPAGQNTDVGGLLNGSTVPSFAADLSAGVGFVPPAGVSFTTLPEPGILPATTLCWFVWRRR